ncbi:glycine cleavage system protein GcvH [Paenibacillus taiwanensis]|uniref:glycine cleavage system protein GcvH n=1 Tax=Paenibacillus taiwanensis TaxID=401638 RepID=UPI00048C2F27|nr:glycine cleavage system protein GcvH [Paenibacillus taiwanensis]
MSEIKNNLLYSEEHEWALVVGERTVRIGITDHAQHQLGDIVFLEFPEVGTALSAGDSMGSIESVKTVSELYTPVTGKVTKVNTELEESPEQVNTEPYESGWIVEIEVEGSMEDALKQLLSPERYAAITE